jgi:ankyrin repeat protein
MAAINDQLAMVNLLLESGAEPNGVFEQNHC